jgi:hypothetical protein
MACYWEEERQRRAETVAYWQAMVKVLQYEEATRSLLENGFTLEDACSNLADAQHELNEATWRLDWRHWRQERDRRSAHG